MKLITIKDHLEVDDLLGAIRYQDEIKFYMLDITDWILNFAEYEPESVGDPDFREGLVNVTNSDIPAYLKYIDDGEVEIADIKSYLTQNGPNSLFPYFYIDFDNYTFINAFPPISVEEYLPHDNWKGIWDTPINYFSDDAKSIWGSS